MNKYAYNQNRANDPAYLARKKLYNSKAWKALRDLKLCEQPTCEQCAKEGLLTAAQHVDHIKPMSQGGAALPDLDGLASLCHACHSRKTRSETTGDGTVRVKGCNPDGTPRDPGHHWRKP